ncbi:leucyl aminopeptidase [Andreprevotia chitinilytica]|uniref:leucyl aminopeptidase n=1 Tax=Andreprevotia chitinilytica TaxID=396808 RepID=UPI000550DC8D|nr:leucyl aminopeptidase [Andreprevotia chitinilytica]
MEFSINLTSPEKAQADCLVLPIAGKKLPTALAKLDEAGQGWISALLASGELAEKSGSTLATHLPIGNKPQKIVLVQVDKDVNAAASRKLADTIAKVLVGGKSISAAVWLGGIRGVDAGALTHAITQSIVAESYRFTAFKSEPDPAPLLAQIAYIVAKKSDVDTAEAGLARGLAVGHGVNFARELGNLPGNACTPTYLADEAVKLARHYGIKADVLEAADMEKLGMGSLLSVAKGSVQPPKLITLEYRGGAKSAKPIALVGKGITFDSGGISLKPGEGMDEMKYDMGGAAAVLGTFRALAELGLPINVVGVIPTCENMPAGNASKPGDVVKSMSGQTIEILNTDAEGRLILCDALTYTAKFEPEVVIDLATLTGACIIALGHVASGLYANNDALADELLAAADESGDKAWRMPLWDDYQEQLKSNFADVANIGGRPAGSVTAACFLARFTKDYTWAHLDIAGTAWKSGAAKGATGRPVPLLVEYLAQRAAKKAKK